MIGLGFLAAGLLWLAFSWYLATRSPKWLSVVKPVWRRMLGVTVFLFFMVGPFVDHIVEMWQFEKLCAEETDLQMSPNAVNTKRGRATSSARDLVGGTAIAINRTDSTITDLDTGELIAQYKHFAIFGDIGADLGLAAELGSSQLLQAAQYYLQIKTANPNATISFTGHSLGGGLASLVAAFFGETDAMVTRLTGDLWKLEQDSGLTGGPKAELLVVNASNDESIYTRRAAS